MRITNAEGTSATGKYHYHCQRKLPRKKNLDDAHVGDTGAQTRQPKNRDKHQGVKDVSTKGDRDMVKGAGVQRHSKAEA